MLLLISSRQKHSLISVLRLVTTASTASTFPFPSPSAESTSNLRTEYSFIAPPSFLPQSPANNSSPKRKRISRRCPSKLLSISGTATLSLIRLLSRSDSVGPNTLRLDWAGSIGNLVAMVRIDCHGLDRSDHKKIGVKLRDLVPCILVSFEKEQTVVWRGANYKSREDGLFLDDRELFDNSDDHLWGSDLD